MYVLIGDLVGSRRDRDRRGLQEAVTAALAEIGALVPGLQPLEATVGDEFQGAWAHRHEALRAALLVDLALRPRIGVRIGIGVGETEVFDPDRRPLLQDGPAWWAARAAIEELGRPRATAHTWYVDDADPGTTVLVNAHLLCRDALIDRLSERGWRMLGLALRGESQQRIAELEGISASAVSQQFARGVGAVRDAQVLLERGEIA